MQLQLRPKTDFSQCDEDPVIEPIDTALDVNKPIEDEALEEATSVLDPEAVPPEPSPPQPNRLVAGLVFATIGAILFSGKGILAKLMFQAGADAVIVITLRMMFALPIFIIMAWWGGRGRPPLTRRDLMSATFLGFIGYYFSAYIDFIGLQYISVNLERMILYLSPTVVLLINRFVFGRPVTWKQVLAVGITYAGEAIVFGHELGHQQGNIALGSFLVFVSAALYAVYLIYSGETLHRVGSVRLAGVASLAASVFTLLTFVAIRPLDQIIATPYVMWMSLANAMCCTAVPVLLVMMGIERIGPALAGQIGMIGPLSTVFMSILVLGEPFTVSLAIGTVVVVTGIWLLTRWRSAPPSPAGA